MIEQAKPTHRIVFRLIDGETTEQIVNARRVTHNVYPDRPFDAAASLRDDVERKLDEGRGVFTYGLTTSYGGTHMVPVRHVLWAKVEPVGESDEAGSRT